MDASKFTDQKTGTLVPITTPLSNDWAFIPKTMPTEWQLPESLIDLEMEAYDRLGTLNGIGNTLPNPELLLKPLEDREALQSSKLEGTYASPEDLLLFAQNPREPKSESDPANSWLEVFNYRKALRHGNNQLKDNRPLSLGLIREMHELLMKGVRGKERTPGEFRQVQVAIGTVYRFIPPPQQFVMDLLLNLESFINEQVTRKRDRLLRCFLAHYQFETIHPFWDGNGRIGRALLALMVYRACDHSLPWLYLSPYFEKHKDEYVSKLFRVSSNGEWTEWVEFCLRGTIEQANDAILRCKMLSSLRQRYLNRVDGLTSSRTHLLIERLFTDPVIGIAEVRKNCGVAYKTAKTDVEILAKAGIVKLLPNHYPTSYYAWEIFMIAFADEPTMIPEKDLLSTEIEPPSSQSLSGPLLIEPSPSPSRPSDPPASQVPLLPGS